MEFHRDAASLQVVDLVPQLPPLFLNRMRGDLPDLLSKFSQDILIMFANDIIHFFLNASKKKFNYLTFFFFGKPSLFPS